LIFMYVRVLRTVIVVFCCENSYIRNTNYESMQGDYGMEDCR